MTLHLQNAGVDVPISILELAKQLLIDFVGFFVLAMEEGQISQFPHFALGR